ncbi:uncharacterized protein METZ01_LOCUS462024, partial [marine metagenome]
MRRPAWPVKVGFVFCSFARRKNQLKTRYSVTLQTGGIPLLFAAPWPIRPLFRLPEKPHHDLIMPIATPKQYAAMLDAAQN